MTYPGIERRKHPRIEETFVISYRIFDEVNNYDLTQTKNLSVGGMLLTTNRQFVPGIMLSIDIRLPFLTKPLTLKGQVVGSKQVVRNLIYDTRLELMEVDTNDAEALNKTVIRHFKKLGEEK